MFRRQLLLSRNKSHLVLVSKHRDRTPDDDAFYVRDQFYKQSVYINSSWEMMHPPSAAQSYTTATVGDLLEQFTSGHLKYTEFHEMLHRRRRIFREHLLCDHGQQQQTVVDATHHDGSTELRPPLFGLVFDGKQRAGDSDGGVVRALEGAGAKAIDCDFTAPPPHPYHPAIQVAPAAEQNGALAVALGLTSFSIDGSSSSRIAAGTLGLSALHLPSSNRGIIARTPQCLAIICGALQCGARGSKDGPLTPSDVDEFLSNSTGRPTVGFLRDFSLRRFPGVDNNGFSRLATDFVSVANNFDTITANMRYACASNITLDDIAGLVPEPELPHKRVCAKILRSHNSTPDGCDYILTPLIRCPYFKTSEYPRHHGQIVDVHPYCILGNIWNTPSVTIPISMEAPHPDRPDSETCHVPSALLLTAVPKRGGVTKRHDFDTILELLQLLRVADIIHRDLWRMAPPPVYIKQAWNDEDAIAEFPKDFEFP